MTVRVIDNAEELRAAAGTHLGYSDWHEIDQHRVDLFAEATGDHQWIHVDPERAKDGPFGTTIAHGLLTLSLIPWLRDEIWRAEVKLGINYGANKVRFPSPVPVGSRVRAGVELVGVVDTPAGLQVTERFTVEVQDAAKPACVAETVSVMVFG
jgi:acyl dehydratase